VAGTTTAEELKHTFVFACVGVDLYALRELSWSFMERRSALKLVAIIPPHQTGAMIFLFWTSCVGLQLLAILALKGIS
jgi:hypothetical protein